MECGQKYFHKQVSGGGHKNIFKTIFMDEKYLLY